ncbi:DUF7521 family protein [Halovenus sp. HT40]|uniref:DUF7521 family protein n=1 Tax=Halovenus sp. HT40 TaxID=3126691 RepID=UPI00300F410D
MIGNWEVVLIGVRVLLLGLGLTTTAISFRAYRRQQTRYLRDATIGFGFITFGVLIEGFLYQLSDLSLTQVHIVESVALACGLGVLLVSFLR